jgi:hypothetical protein
MSFILNDLKCYGNVTSSLEFIFEVQRKMSNEKITRKEMNFPTYKTFFFPSLDPSYIQTS